MSETSSSLEPWAFFLKSGGCRTPLRSAIANCTSALAAALTSGGFRGQCPLGEGVAEDPAWVASSLFGVRNDVSYAGAEATFGHLAL